MSLSLCASVTPTASAPLPGLPLHIHQLIDKLQDQALCDSLRESDQAKQVRSRLITAIQELVAAAGAGQASHHAGVKACAAASVADKVTGSANGAVPQASGGQPALSEACRNLLHRHGLIDDEPKDWLGIIVVNITDDLGDVLFRVTPDISDHDLGTIINYGNMRWRRGDLEGRKVQQGIMCSALGLNPSSSLPAIL